MIGELPYEHGLAVRGGFNFGAGEAAPPGPSGRPAKALLLVGNIGATFWRHFEGWRNAQGTRMENPLDTWSRLVIEAAGERIGARTVLPNDRPFLPFQQWAMRAELLRPSPLGILMHPRYGLWHAYRGALLFDRELPLEPAARPIHLCDQCADKPCLRACPVHAHAPPHFAHQKCLSHVRSEAGEACRSVGCLDRNACPAATEYRYPPAVQKFFMDAFAA